MKDADSSKFQKYTRSEYRSNFHIKLEDNHQFSCPISVSQPPNVMPLSKLLPPTAHLTTPKLNLCLFQILHRNLCRCRLSSSRIPPAHQPTHSQRRGNIRRSRWRRRLKLIVIIIRKLNHTLLIPRHLILFITFHNRLRSARAELDGETFFERAATRVGVLRTGGGGAVNESFDLRDRDTGGFFAVVVEVVRGFFVVGAGAKSSSSERSCTDRFLLFRRAVVSKSRSMSSSSSSSLLADAGFHREDP